MAAVAVVSGASSGLGRSLALVLADAGWDVAVGARRVERLEELTKEIEAKGVRAFAHKLDLRSASSIDAFVSGTVAALGSVELLVNNAGLAIPGALAEQSIEEIQRVIETNLTGALLLTNAVAGRWEGEDARRALVFISSSQAAEVTPHLLPYGASKRAIEYAADGLRAELRARGARVLTVRLGAVETPFRSEFETDRAVAMVQFWREAGLASPNRGGERMPAEQVARAIVSCLSGPMTPYAEFLDLRN